MADSSIPAGRGIKCCTVLPTLEKVTGGYPDERYVNLPSEVAGKEILSLLISGVYQTYYTAGIYSADGVTFKGWTNDFTTFMNVVYEKANNRLHTTEGRFTKIGYSMILYR